MQFFCYTLQIINVIKQKTYTRPQWPTRCGIHGGLGITRSSSLANYWLFVNCNCNESHSTQLASTLMYLAYWFLINISISFDYSVTVGIVLYIAHLERRLWICRQLARMVFVWASNRSDRAAFSRHLMEYCSVSCEIPRWINSRSSLHKHTTHWWWLSFANFWQSKIRKIPLLIVLRICCLWPRLPGNDNDTV